ncbi:MAG: alpha/beta hydrolase [Acidobacteriota bacterium]|nr:alpha/beta hydrolase [Acidobacteriota bacterium]
MHIDFAVLPAIIVVASLTVTTLALRSLRNFRNANTSQNPRKIKRAALSLLALCGLAIAVSTGINALIAAHFRSPSTAPGTIYTVNGLKMHIDCTGQGEPTVILDSGLGDDSLIWGKVQPELSKTTRVCSYDRAGFGWSQPGPNPQDADRIAQQLHGLLQQADIRGPIVLMGHSIAGMYIRDYASRYPEGVAGLIFVDASTPLQEHHGSRPFQSLQGQKHRAHLLFLRITDVLGFSRLRGYCSILPEGFPEPADRLLAEHRCNEPFTAIDQELENFTPSGQETIHTGPYGDLPILIFSQDPNHPPRGLSGAMAAEFSGDWNRMQEDLKRLSTRSVRIIATGSGHAIMFDRPDLLNREVPRFIHQIRTPASAPKDNGSTTIE